MWHTGKSEAGIFIVHLFQTLALSGPPLPIYCRQPVESNGLGES
jgi:hypothetical protein